MASTHRRSFLRVAGIIGVSTSLAGCSGIGLMDSSEDLPAGSLKFDNDHTVPHEISIEVLNVGTSKGERRDGHDTVTGTPDTAVPNEISLRQLSLNPDKHRPMNPCSSHESGMTFDSHSTTSTRGGPRKDCIPSKLFERRNYWSDIRQVTYRTVENYRGKFRQPII